LNRNSHAWFMRRGGNLSKLKKKTHLMVGELDPSNYLLNGQFKRTTAKGTSAKSSV